MRLTFKKQPRATGLIAVGYDNQSVDIKLDGKIFGIIAAPNWQTADIWKIRFMVKKTPTADDTCEWKWMRVKKDFATEEEARQFMKSHIQEISQQFILRFFEDA